MEMAEAMLYGAFKMKLNKRQKNIKMSSSESVY